MACCQSSRQCFKPRKTCCSFILHSQACSEGKPPEVRGVIEAQPMHKMQNKDEKLTSNTHNSHISAMLHYLPRANLVSFVAASARSRSLARFSRDSLVCFRNACFSCSAFLVPTVTLRTRTFPSNIFERFVRKYGMQKNPQELGREKTKRKKKDCSRTASSWQYSFGLADLPLNSIRSMTFSKPSPPHRAKARNGTQVISCIQ